MSLVLLWCTIFFWYIPPLPRFFQSFWQLLSPGLLGEVSPETLSCIFILCWRCRGVHMCLGWGSFGSWQVIHVCSSLFVPFERCVWWFQGALSISSRLHYSFLRCCLWFSFHLHQETLKESVSCTFLEGQTNILNHAISCNTSNQLFLLLLINTSLPSCSLSPASVLGPMTSATTSVKSFSLEHSLLARWHHPDA